LEGTVLKDLKKNRVGFCVLHPLDNVIGKPVEITHPDGSRENGAFPVSIAAENPFRNIKSMRWSFHGHWYELSFEGDVFETEDQRNWIDHSFKTFCTPSHLPIPVTLSKGEKIFQKITFRPNEKLQAITSHDETLIELEKTGQRTRLPQVGLCATEIPVSEKPMSELKMINFDHVRIAVSPSKSDWASIFSQQCEFAYALKLPIKAALTVSNDFNDDIEKFLTIVQQNRLKVKEVILLSEGRPVTEAEVLYSIPEIKSRISGVIVGAGTDSHFKEINRNRIASDVIDFVSFAAFPQVHAKDDRTIIENIDGLRETGASGAMLYPGKPIHISPLTFQTRDAKQEDPRLQTQFGALWAFGCIRAAAEGRIASISLLEGRGNNGLVSQEGTGYPVHHVLEKLLRFRKHDMIVLKNSEPLLIDAMLLSNDSSTTLFLVNYTDDLQTVRYGKNIFQVSPNNLLEVNLSGT
jgi:D-apionolactonase